MPCGFRFSPRSNRASEIDWRHWGREAFEEADREGKLVLLSISASWCHWCHVMDENTYSDPRVIEKINSDFIPVRVDSDMRPDINRRYNQGGWPTTAFLIPSGRAVAGLTYAPPELLLPLLERLSDIYRCRKEEIELEAAKALAQEESLISSFGEGEPVSSRVLEDVLSAIECSWDKEYGGLGRSPKFPPLHALDLVLSLLGSAEHRGLREFVMSTLDGMKNGGLFDYVEGGFFRYATASDWSMPHFEKMLEDNAELSRIYLRARVILGIEEYEEMGRKTVEYCLAALYLPHVPGFAGSRDADEDYYNLDIRSRKEVAPPPADRNIYVDSNSLMASSLLYASSVLNMPSLRDRAEEVLDFLWEKARDTSGVMFHYVDPDTLLPELPGQPRDQVMFLKSLLEAYKLTAKRKYLERAHAIADVLVKVFVGPEGWIGEAQREAAGRAEDTTGWAPESNNGCEIVGEGERERGRSPMSALPLDMPDIAVNGIGALCLSVLDALYPGESFGAMAARIADSLKGVYPSFSHFASPYALAVRALLDGHAEIRVSPGIDDEFQRRVFREAFARTDLRTVVRFEEVDDLIASFEGSGRPAVVLCASGRCVSAETPDDFERALDALISDGLV